MHSRVSLVGLAALMTGCVPPEFAPYGGDVELESSSSDESSSSPSSSSSADETTGELPDELPLPEYDGEPLPDSPVGQWSWVDFPDAFCRDGTSTGIGVRRGSSPNLIFFFEGGGACFNAFTCLANPSHYGLADFLEWSGAYRGIFDDERPDNPVADWTAVYVPTARATCTRATTTA